MVEIDTWKEDDYDLVLCEYGIDDPCEFRLFVRKPGQLDQDVTGDTDAYGRRIKFLSHFVRPEIGQRG